jgi:hypothetical protein
LKKRQPVGRFIVSRLLVVKILDKNLKALWPFTDRLVNEYTGDMKGEDIDSSPDNLLVKWIALD